MERVKGPDFPNGALIVGRRGSRTRTGPVAARSSCAPSSTSRRTSSGRTLLVVNELPHMVNPDNLAQKIAELVNTGKLTGIADIRDDTSARTGQRLVIVLKRDAQPRVVLNNLYKHTQLQDTFGCNMLALVDDVPRTLRLDQFISYWVAHQIEVIQRRTQHRLDDAEADAHIYRGLVKALDALDEVIALIRRSPSTDDARDGLMALLEIDEVQANAILDMQLRRLAALERQRIIDRLAEFETDHRRPAGHPGPAGAAAQIISDELGEIVDEVRRRAADRDHRGRRRPVRRGPDPRQRGGGHHHPRRLRQADQHRRVPGAEAWRQGRTRVRACGPTTRSTHLFATTNHHWILFFTNKGRVYRAKVWQLPEAGRDAKGGARRRPAVLPARRGDRPGAGDPRLRRRRRTCCWPPSAAWSRRPRCRCTTRRGRPASSRSTSATTTTS